MAAIRSSSLMRPSYACSPAPPELLRRGKRQGQVISMESDVRCPLDLHPLMTQKLAAGAPMNSPTPVPPEKRLTSNGERMQQRAYLAGLRGFAAIPLALLT